MNPYDAEEKPSAHQLINRIRRELCNIQTDVRHILCNWASDEHRAATDISVNSLMLAHLHITEAIKMLNQAQSHTEDI